MDVFIKAIIGVLIASIFCLVLSKHGKDMALLLTITVCCLVIAAAVSYLRPVIDFLHRLETLGQLNADMIGILLKAVGIGLLSEVAGLICTDAGNSSLGKALQVLSAAVILWLALPLFNELIELIEKLLGAL